MGRMARDPRVNPPIPPLHPERDALLAAVRDAAPDDDLPALVYADWQDEHGQPEHAELIRVMTELPKYHKRTPEAKGRKKELLARMKALFRTEALRPLRALQSNVWRFRRGFIPELILELVEQRTPGRRVAGEVPVTELPDLPTRIPFDKLAWLGFKMPQSPRTDHLEVLAGLPWLGRVDWLGLQQFDSNHVGPGLLAPLIDCDNLGGLRTFDIGFQHFNRQGVIAASELAAVYLARSATGLREFPMGNAQRLTTPDATLRPTRQAFFDAVERIVSAPRANQFVSFGVEVTTVDEPLANLLTASKHLGNIRQFRYVFEKARPKTQALFVERFGPPVRR